MMTMTAMGTTTTIPNNNNNGHGATTIPAPLTANPQGHPQQQMMMGQAMHQQQQQISAASGHTHSHNHHHHHHHHNNMNNNHVGHVMNGHHPRNLNQGPNTMMLHGTPNHVAADFMGTGRDMEGCSMEPNPMYMNLSHSRDCLDETTAMGDHGTGSLANPVHHPQLPMNDQSFSFSVANPQVVKQPLAKTNSDGGVVEVSSTNAGQDMSRMFSSRDGNKYGGQRGQRLHRTIPRHFTTTVPSGSAQGQGGLAASVPQDNPKDIRDQTLKRNKSEKMTSSSSGNKKPVCQCPIQHVPMTYMGSTTIGSNQLLASNLTGPTKLGSHHHHKSMLNVAKLTQQQQQMVLEPAKGYDDELKLMSNSLRRIKTKVCVVGDVAPTAEGMVGGKGSDVKIPTISKQVVLNSDKEQAAAVVTAGTGIDGLQSILKHSLPSKSATRPGIGEVDLINPPPFPLEMIDSLAVGQQQSHPKSIPPGSDPHPALPPKMFKTHRGNIQTISKSSSRLTQFKGDVATSATPGYSQTRPAAQLFRTTTATMAVQQNALLNSKSPTTSSFPSTVSHISFSLPKSSGGDNGGAKSIKSQPTAASAAAGGSKVVTPSTVQKPRSNAEQQSGCAKSVGESHFNHNNNPNYQQQQPKNSAKAQHVSKSGEVDKGSPLPVCTTSKNCSNPREHFISNEASLDDDYLSECENCKSVCGSRYYLEEEGGGPSSPQETMTLQRKMPEANESEEQAYYRTSSTLPTNTKQKNQ